MQFLPNLQVSVSLMGSGVQPDSHDNLIELVGSPETCFLDLFSQQQLQARYYFFSNVTGTPIIIYKIKFGFFFF
jgi:hypothetical protein